jgi:HlyD family secretion protein
MGMDKPRDEQYKKKKKIIKITTITGISLIVFFLLFVMIFGSKNSKLNISLDKITIDEVKKDLFLDYISVIGTVQPIKVINLDVTEGGKVEERYLEAGAKVKAGDIILGLSNDNLLLNISTNEADVSRAINDLKTMQFNLANQKRDNKTRLIELHYDLLNIERRFNSFQALLKDGHISQEDYNIAKENYERNKELYEVLKEKSEEDSVFMIERLSTAGESVNRMQKNLGLIRKRVENLFVKAPVDGELASLNVEIGSVLTYGQRIGAINILDSYKLLVEIDEHYISRIILNLKGKCNFSDKEYPATIKKIYPEVREGRFYADMEFVKEVPAEIKIGQTSNVSLELGTPENAIIISRGAFYQNTGGQWIYVVDESGSTAVKRNIKIGRQNPQFYEVLEGLNPGEKVITSGYENFGDAEKLIIKKN